MVKITVLRLEQTAACFWLAALALSGHVVDSCSLLINDCLGCWLWQS